MKIGFVTHTAYPEGIGGREHHIHSLAKTISEQKNDEVIVFTASIEKKVKWEKIDETYWLVKIPSIPITVSKNPLQIYHIVPKLYSLLKQVRPDILHLFEYGSYATTVASFYAIHHHIPFVFTVYGYQLKKTILKCCKKAFDVCVGKYLLKKSRAIICVSRQQHEEMIQIGSHKIKNKMFIRANSVLIQDFKQINKDVLEKFREEYSLIEKGIIRLLTVARILPRKGIDTLLYALERVKRYYKRENIQLVLVGPDHGELKNLQSLINKLHLNKTVSVVGSIPYHEIKYFFHACDIFVLPSLYEGIPLVIFEAMSGGKPIISTSLVGIKSIVKNDETGLLVEPMDVNALADAIVRLSSDGDLRKEMGENARNEVQKYDSSCEVEFLYKSIYTKLV